MDRHKSKWRYLHVIRNKKVTFSPQPMAAIFDLTIASLVAPWWTSTSVIPHVSRPTNSVQVSGSTGQVLDYRSQPLHLCRPASQNHCSLLWVILAPTCWTTISLREPLWMCASRCPSRLLTPRAYCHLFMSQHRVFMTFHNHSAATPFGPRVLPPAA